MRIQAVLASVLLTAATASCGGQSPRTATAAEPNVVTINTHDYAFESPDEIPAGLTTFRLVNRGSEGHHLIVVRLDDGTTVDDFYRIATDSIAGMPGTTMLGGPEGPAEGEEAATATLVLRPGNYVMACFISGEDGMPHLMKGMFRPFTVTGPEPSDPALPEADVVMSLSDYDFELSRPITAGRHTLRIENRGPQRHHVIIGRIEPGKTLDDVLAWTPGSPGPAPLTYVGGVTTITPGENLWLTLDFEPGDYALLCLVPDEGNGQPHLAHGMAKQIRVE